MFSQPQSAIGLQFLMLGNRKKVNPVLTQLVTGVVNGYFAEHLFRDAIVENIQALNLRAGVFNR